MTKLRLYSRNCEYVVRVLAYVVSQKIEDGFYAEKVCKKLKIPECYTRKGLQILSRMKILRSNKGPGGGYRFERNVGQLSLLDVILAVEGKDCFDRCIVGESKCGQRDSCVIHRVWAPVRAKLLKEFGSIKLNDLVT